MFYLNLLSALGITVKLKENSLLSNLGVDEYGNPIKESTDNIVKMISGTFSNKIETLQKQVIPMVQELSGKIEEDLVSKSSTNRSELFSIIKFNIPKYILDLDAKNYFTIGMGFGAKITERLMLPKMTVDEIRMRISKYSKNSEEIINILDTINDKKLLTLYEDCLLNIFPNNTEFLKYRGNDLSNIYNLTCLLILIESLMEEPVATSNRNLKGYNKALLNVRAYVVRNISELLVKYKYEIDKNKLVIKVMGTDKLIYVLEETYNKYLEEDNSSVEAIFGVGEMIEELSDSDLTIDEILLNKAKYEREFETAYKNLNVEKTHNALKDIKHIISNNFIAIVRKHDIVNDTVKDYEILTDNVKKYINSKEALEKDLDIDEVSKYLICKFIYPDLMAYEFLKYADKYMKMNKDITSKEAATYASMELVYDILLDHIEVVKNK